MVVKEYRWLNKTKKIVSKKENTEEKVLAAAHRKPKRFHKTSDGRTRKRGPCFNREQMGHFPRDCRLAERNIEMLRAESSQRRSLSGAGPRYAADGNQN